jgi:hypothetical protein
MLVAIGKEPDLSQGYKTGEFKEGTSGAYEKTRA